MAPIAIDETLPPWMPPDVAARRTEYTGLLRVRIGEDGRVLSANGKRLGRIPGAHAFAKEWTRGFSAVWQRRGGALLTNNEIDYNTTTDFSSVVSKALSERPDVLFVGGPSQATALVIKAAREQGFKGIVTTQGTTALSMVNELRPSAILLDIFLPDIEGWRVLSRLKNDINVRHIPVHVVSTDDARNRALDSGARRFIAKPLQSRKAVDEVIEEIYKYTTSDRRQLLLVEPDLVRLATMREYLSSLENVDVISASDGPRAAELMREGRLDCAVVNPDTPDFDLVAVMEEMREVHTSPPPVIAYGRKLAASVGAANGTLPEHVPGLREVHSVERLLDQVVMALHIDVSHVSDAHRKVLEDIYGSTKALAGRRVLIVDDDIRNIFALSSVLEDYGMEIRTADNGRDAIAIAQRGDLDIILMDIMMPEMDGLETTREIRKIPCCKELPIVAVTAKAMKGDRERCIEAGAWDYLSKPVDRDQLLTVLKAWLQR